MPSSLVGLENLDMDDTEDEIQQQEDSRDWNIGYDIWTATQSMIARRIWRTLVV